MRPLATAIGVLFGAVVIPLFQLWRSAKHVDAAPAIEPAAVLAAA